jgi:hypothetical protein
MKRMRGLLLLAWVAASAASAQVSSSGDRTFQAGREGDLNQWLIQAQRNRTLTEGERAVQAVSGAIVRGDCAAAASALNAGLAKQHTEVWMLAGAMFEDGLCLKANWERALNFYQRADNAGQPAAAGRLASGYATPAGGRDLAASLWWAVRAKTALPAPCAQAAPLAGDPDRFIAALNAWPAGQLAACAYAGAVMSTLQSELVAPDLGASLGLEGTIRITFVPAEARIDLTDDLVAAGGLVADAATRTAEARATRAALQEQLRQTADRALKRHVKPGVVPAAWRVEAQHALRLAR